MRTEGIYTIMITLAIASAFYYLTLQNYTIFNGFSGFIGILPPVFLGIDWGQSLPFYYLTLGCAALAYGAVIYVSRAPFGLALQGTRDNPRRMAALGFNVTAHRVAAHALASVFASVGGILLARLIDQPIWGRGIVRIRGIGRVFGMRPVAARCWLNMVVIRC